MLKIKNLDKNYGRTKQNSVHAVNNISLELPDRGMVAIFGKSGCGKTTLLNIVGGLDKADSGCVELDGEKISPDASDARNINIGYIFQNYNLQNNKTVYENVAASLRLCGLCDEAEIDRRVMAALCSVEMEKYKNRTPDALSGGQQQRVAIARAIVKNPHLILADEPTGNLDEQNTLMVMDLLRSIAKEHLVLLVTHEESLVDLYCDKVIEIVDGRVTAQRDNEGASGYTGRSKNDVYLGDMRSSSAMGEGMRLEFYGDDCDKPQSITVISHKGTLYIKADTNQKLKFIDNSAEIKIHTGKYEDAEKREPKELDAALKAPVQYGKTGRMYNLKGAVVSGFKNNFGKKKKGKKFLFSCLVMFAAIVVFVTAAFGVCIKNVKDIKLKYHSDQVLASGKELNEESIQELYDSGYITFSKYMYQANLYYTGMLNYQFRIGNFETFIDDYNMFFSASAFPMPIGQLKNSSIVCGTDKITEDNQIVITRALADELLKVCGVDYIKEYTDLLYTAGSDMGWTSRDNFYTVVGIVEDTNAVVYKSDYEYARCELLRNNSAGPKLITDTEHLDKDYESYKDLEKGEIYVSSKIVSKHEADTTLMVNGREFKVKGIIENNSQSFEDFVIEQCGIDVTQGLDIYLEYVRAPYMKSFENWLSYMGYSQDDVENGGLKGIYESDLNYYENDYDYFISDMKRQYENGEGGEYKIIMSPEDYAYLPYTVGEFSSEAANYFNFGNYSYGAGFAFFTKDQDALKNKLIEMGIDEEDIFTSEELYDYYSADYKESFTVLTIALVAVVAVMSVCMYFIMRSTLMGDIKEVGICRAIGVSKKNIIYRYFVEAAVLFALTVFVGFIISSGGVWGLLSGGRFMQSFVYYPWWLSLITFSGLFGICAFCGILPVLMLLSRTPAQILSKYDI